MNTPTIPAPVGLGGQLDNSNRRPKCPTCRRRMRGLLSGCTNPNCRTAETVLDHMHVRSADQ